MVQDFFHQYVAYISSFQVWGSDWPQKRFSARSMAKWIGTTNSSTIEASREGVQHGIKTPPMGWYRIDMKLACSDWWMHILEAYVKILVTLECYKGLLDWFVFQFLLYVPIKMCQFFCSSLQMGLQPDTSICRTFALRRPWNWLRTRRQLSNLHDFLDKDGCWLYFMHEIWIVAYSFWSLVDFKWFGLIYSKQINSWRSKVLEKEAGRTQNSITQAEEDFQQSQKSGTWNFHEFPTFYSFCDTITLR